MGEVVIVEFGRRQALGVVLGEAPLPPTVVPKAVRARVRSDGPLLPELGIALCRWIAEEYLAPPAVVVRAMLPPGLLERTELVATRREPPPGDADSSGEAAEEADLLEALSTGPRTVRDLQAPDGRATLLRRLRALERTGRIRLEWTLTEPGAGPRLERTVALTDAGRLAAAGERPPDGRALGPRQVALLRELRQAELEATGDAGEADDATSVGSGELGARHGGSAIAGLARRGLVILASRERPRDPLEARPPGEVGTRPDDSILTAAQAAALRVVRRAVTDRDPTPILLDGVTGSGKTAVYASAIADSLAAGRPAIVLVPEIALALPLVDRLRAELSVRVALVHSGMSVGQRADEWRRIRSGKADVVVGTRLAILAPLRDVGLLIVDEEHDPAYKSDRTPRLQARDTAIALGRLAGATVVLGSATPAVETIGRARIGTYRRVELAERASGRLPEIELVDLRAELAAGNRGLLSATLIGALRALDAAAGDQAILVLNRRGTASVVLCRDCGSVQRCPECDRPLVFHQAGMSLRCHHCGTAAPLATRCPACSSPRIRYLGGGTERVEREVVERVPGLRVGRLDRDIVERRGAAERVIDAFAGGGLDVLVGTSLVTKGLDVPTVTLVGVVSADVALNLPDERAAERTYQFLVQAVGRAGRGVRPGRAIIQSYQPGHPAIQAVLHRDPVTFYDAELELRRRFGSPPFGRLVKLTIGLPDREAASRAATGMVETLRARAAERGARVTVVGPAPAYIARRAGRWRWNVIVRGEDPVALLDGGLPAPWSVDVDPESLL